MATVAFTAAVGGAATGAGLSATDIFFAKFAAGLFGAILDRSVIFPALFPQPTQEGPKLGDLHMASADEGASWPYALGSNVRVPGIVLWCSDLIPHKDTTNGGGKGGTGGDFVEYKYSVDVAVGFAETDGVPITQFVQLLADTKKIYDVTGTLTLTGAFSATASSSQTYGQSFAVQYLEIFSTTGGPDLGQFVSGKTMDVSGFSAAADNGTFKVTDSGDKFDSSGNKIGTFVKVILPAAGATLGSGTTITLFQKVPTFSTKRMASIHFYLGDGTQKPDSLIEAREGSGNVPAFRNRAYCVIRGLQLFDYGNRLPNFEAILKPVESETVGGATAKLMTRSGFEPSEVDATLLTDTLDGYATLGNVDGNRALQPLALAFDVIARQERDKYVFYPRASVPTIAIDPTYLAAGIEGRDASRVDRPIKVSDTIPPMSLPTEVTVRYRDIDKKLNGGAARDRRKPPFAPVKETIDLNVSLDSTRARAIANRVLWTAWANRTRVTFMVPPVYLGQLREGTRCTFTTMNEDWVVLVDRVDRDTSFLMTATGVVEDVRTLTGLAVGDPPGAQSNFTSGNQNRTNEPPVVRFEVIDTPALRDQDNAGPGFYIACCSATDAVQFSGAVIYESQDSGASWHTADVVRQAATIGTATAVPTVSVSAGSWDYANTITVEMTNGTLSDITETEVLNGGNRAVLNGEVIAFQYAELTAPKTYVLSKLLRGLRGTELQIDGHAAGERFVMLNAPGIVWHPVQLSAIGTSRLYKAVANGQALEEVDALAITPQGNTIMPFAPASLTGTRDGSNNLTIGWSRRTRSIIRAFSGYTAPILERSELYDVDIMDKATALIVKRTFSNVSTTSQAYSAANQTTDGYTPGDRINVRIYQRGEFIGRGFAAIAAV